MLCEFAKTIPAFTFGEDFAIVNGVSPLLPGMMFSTTPFVLLPGGPSGTPFTGEAEVLTDHIPSVAEPASMIALTFGLLGLRLARRRSRGYVPSATVGRTVQEPTS